MIKAKLAAALALCVFSVSASASVITFDGLAGANLGGNSWKNNTYGIGTISYFNQGAVEVEGYAFTAALDAIMFMPSNVTDPTGTKTWAWNGTDFMALFNGTMTSAAATPFSVESIDIGNRTSGNLMAILTGVKTDGSQVVLRINADFDNTAQSSDFVTYQLSDFTDLQSLRFLSQNGLLSVDNIRITDVAPPATVPEPASLGLLGAGILIAGLARRRRK